MHQEVIKTGMNNESALIVESEASFPFSTAFLLTSFVIDCHCNHLGPGSYLRSLKESGRDHPASY